MLTKQGLFLSSETTTFFDFILIGFELLLIYQHSLLPGMTNNYGQKIVSQRFYGSVFIYTISKQNFHNKF